MCVILCLFSALSRRVGALQISIIIIVHPSALTTDLWLMSYFALLNRHRVF